MTTADDVLRMLRAALEESDPIDRKRLVRRAYDEAQRLSDDDFDRVAEMLGDDYVDVDAALA